MTESDSQKPLLAQLNRIERAFFYDPQRMAEIHAREGTVTHHRESHPHHRQKPICLVSGNGNRPLAEAVALLLGIPTHLTSVTQYANGEVNVRINESVLGADVYIIQSTTGNDIVDLNTALMELLILIRKMRLSNAKTVTVIIPFYGYSRQDQRTEENGPISASLVARMLVQMGADRVTTLDLHSNQTQGFFDTVPLDNLLMAHEFAAFLRQQPWFEPDRCVIVSPDANGVERAKKLADILSVGRIVTIVKRRMPNGQSDVMQTVGEVSGLHCVIVDDLVETGETIMKACALLKELGAHKVYACCTHGILAGNCVQQLNECEALEQIVVSDSIPQERHKKELPKLRVLTVAPLLAVVIHKYANNESISSLFDMTMKP